MLLDVVASDHRVVYCFFPLTPHHHAHDFKNIYGGWKCSRVTDPHPVPGQTGVSFLTKIQVVSSVRRLETYAWTSGAGDDRCLRLELVGTLSFLY